MTLYDVILWIHITAVFAAFGTLFAYPVFLAVNAKAPLSQRANFHRLQIAFSKRITGPAIGVVLAAGVYLASDAHLWSQAWVPVGLVLLVVIAGLGATVLRKGELALIAASESGTEEDYAGVLSRVSRWTLLTIALIAFTVFDMTAKPFT